MKVTCKLKPFPHIIINDLLDAETIPEVIEEIKQIIKNNPTGTNTGSSLDSYGVSNKRGAGVFVDDLFVSDARSKSKILTEFNKVFCQEIKTASNKIGEKDQLYNIYSVTNVDWTLLQWYGDGDYYKPHTDRSIFTVITLLQLKKRKKYKGGELNFCNYNYTINLKHNQTVIFPSLVEHQVFPVKLDSNDITDSRVTVTKFVHFNSSR